MQKLKGRPVIGIGCDVAAGPPPASLLRLEYSDAVAGAGGSPVLLPPFSGREEARAALLVLDGLLLSGGDDYPPSLYHQPRHPSVRTVHPRRRQGDLHLAQEALRGALPVLGICGGMQLMNIVRGGSLLQDIPSLVPGARTHRGPPGGPPAPHHPVEVRRGTLLRSLVGRSRLEVNSSHHQAVRRPGRGLTVAAEAEDGVVEALEGEGRFILGVQWHPERDLRAFNRALFEGLVDAARAARGRRSPRRG